MRILLIPLFGLVACGGDADYDGFTDDDCDDEDALVYPGAPDAPGDGIDADCDGTDPDYPFLGIWNIDTFVADYSGLFLFIPDTEEGNIGIGGDFAATLNISATLDPAVAGQALPLSLAFAGQASPFGSGSEFSLDVEGFQFDEQMNVQLECAMSDDAQSADCGGSVKALNANLNLQAVLVR